MWRMRLWSLAVLAVLWLTPGALWAQDECHGQLREARELKYAGKLLLARPLAVACAESPGCEPATQHGCRQLVASLSDQIPSLVFSIRDEHGFETDQVSLYIDGELRVQSLPNTPIELDPGTHELRAELRSGASRSLRVVLATGEQLRRVSLTFEAPKAPVMARAAGSPRWLTLSLGTLALASAGSFAYFASDGRARVRELEAGCAPRCEPGPVSDMRRAMLVADVSWIVGVLAAGGATWSLLAE